ncbi:hypothetical protein M407DRAFT_30297 [Tulasnella calospora MUT 4182]|uniref:FAR1 domain-containing protein n=1 Tax=Tulasnella calospora MUT 4182 TaxID=1051891 RepID=A0A0C3LF18_9AGAM|nr:hypothetical protein M407DRAFT_30297 [Tulasnella calospora MUT 4182]
MSRLSLQLPLTLPVPLPLQSPPPTRSLSASREGSESSSDSGSSSGGSWGGVRHSSPPSDMSTSPSTVLASIPSSHPLGSIREDSRLEQAIKEEPVEIVDLTGETPSPVKVQVQKRCPSLIILSSDEDRQSPPRKRRRHLSSTMKAGAIAQPVDDDQQPQGTRRTSKSTHKKSSIILLSDSDSDSDLNPLPRPPPRHQSPVPTLPAIQQPAPTSLVWGREYDTLELAEAAVKLDAEEHGFIMVRGQSIKEEDGTIRKRTMRCKCYRQPVEYHDLSLHPSDHREGKSFRTGCFAHVNIRRVNGSPSFYLSLVDTSHNHLRTLPLGGHAQSRPTEQQRQFIAKYAEHGGFSRQQMLHMLETEGIGHQLEPRQMTNVINQSRRDAQAEIQALGGDIAAVIAALEEKQREDPRWQYRGISNMLSRTFMDPSYICLGSRWP